MSPLMVIEFRKIYELIFGWGAKAVYTDQELLPEHLETAGNLGFSAMNYAHLNQLPKKIKLWKLAQDAIFVPEVVGVLHLDGRLDVWSEDAVDDVLSELLLSSNEVKSEDTSLIFIRWETKQSTFECEMR